MPRIFTHESKKRGNYMIDADSIVAMTPDIIGKGGEVYFGVPSGHNLSTEPCSIRLPAEVYSALFEWLASN